MKRCMGCMKEYEEEYDLCPYCGYAEGDGAASEYHLPPGSILADRYLLGRVMGFGGFGITYTGWDRQLDRQVAIKEYLPSQYATRTREDSTLTIYSGEKERQFLEGMEKFSGEAKRLAKFQGTEGIVQILDTFRENKTAYIVMEYLEGETLKDRLEREGKIPVDEAIELMIPILESLEIVHQEGILHRDIAPDNIFLCRDGEGNVKAKLLDFGAARFVGGRQSRSLTVLVKEGYSPYEQYRSDGEQGPWTDVYAVAATMYHMITGVKPQNAMERYGKDAVLPIRKLAKIEKSTEAAILNAMNITYEYRTNDAGLFLEELRSDQVKRVRDRIIRTDIGRWPRWMKVTASSAAATVAVFIVLLATGVIRFDVLGSGESAVPEGMARVPNLISMTEQDAEKKAGKNKLVFQILGKEYSDEIPAGRVLAQTTLGGSIVDAESTIGVIISGGAEKTYVPDTVHFMEDVAAKMIAGANLTYSASQEAGDDAPGSVASQDIAAGTQVDAGSGMKLVISTGRGFDPSVETSVPDVTGRQYDEGKVLALESRLYMARAEIVYDKSIPAGQIMGQTPAAGEKTAQGGTIMVKVSSGAALVHVPDTQYKTLEEAQAMLEAAQLAVQTVYEDSNAVQKDRVIRQSIEAGKEVDPGTTVTIYISKGNEKADQTLTTQNAVVTREIQEAADKATSEVAKHPEPSAKEDTTATPEGTTASVPRAPSGWTTDGSFAGDPRYRCEAKTQYRTQTRTATEETTTSTDSAMPGWTKYNETQSWGEYGGWSDWSETSVAGSDSRKVETRKVSREVETGKVYRYTTWYIGGWGDDDLRNWYWDNSQGGEMMSETVPAPLSPNEYSYYAMRFGVVDYVCYYHDHMQVHWFNEQPESIMETRPVTEYRYQDRSQITTYHYKRTVYGDWGSWGDWQDSPATKNDVTNVETRTVYSYTAK